MTKHSTNTDLMVMLSRAASVLALAQSAFHCTPQALWLFERKTKHVRGAVRRPGHMAVW